MQQFVASMAVELHAPYGGSPIGCSGAYGIRYCIAGALAGKEELQISAEYDVPWRGARAKREPPPSSQITVEVEGHRVRG
jgi:hypothetical protein